MRLRPEAVGRSTVALAGALGLAVGLSTGLPGCRPDATSSAPESAAEAIVARAPRSDDDNGLEVAHWSVANDEVRISAAFDRRSLHDPSMRSARERLARVGFRAAMVAEADLPGLLEDLGGTTTALATWHGQITEWREIARRSTESPLPVIVGGRVEMLPPGHLRLMVRAWTVPLEDGAVLDVESAPQWIGDTNEMSAVLNRDALRGRVFPEGALDVELTRGTALVITAQPPTSAHEPDPERPPASDGKGPYFEPPPTPGELLLTDPGVPPRRAVLVLRARLPDTLFPGLAPIEPATPLPEPVPNLTTVPDATRQRSLIEPAEGTDHRARPF